MTTEQVYQGIKDGNVGLVEFVDWLTELRIKDHNDFQRTLRYDDYVLDDPCCQGL